MCIKLKNDLYWIWFWSEFECGDFVGCWDGPKLVYMLWRNGLSGEVVQQREGKVKTVRLKISEK